jgi:hypothetical protein
MEVVNSFISMNGSRQLKVAIYKYLTNEFVYKNEGVGAMAEQSDQIRKIFTHIFW